MKGAIVSSNDLESRPNMVRPPFFTVIQRHELLVGQFSVSWRDVKCRLLPYG
jgi:hypothetical protein